MAKKKASGVQPSDKVIRFSDPVKKMTIPKEFRATIPRSAPKDQLKEIRAMGSKKPRNELEEAMLILFHKNIEAHLTFKSGQRWATHFDYILKNGLFWTPAPRPKGVRLRANRDCMGNSQNLAYEHAHFTYVEGYAFAHDHPFNVHHGWCITSEGNVVDQTWKEPGTVYFGIPFPREEVKSHFNHMALHHGVSGFILGIDYFFKDTKRVKGMPTIYQDANEPDE